MLKSLSLVSSIDQTIDNFDDDEATDFYFTALIVIAEEFNISMNDAHLGIVDMKEEMDLIIDKPEEHELHTKH